MSLHPVIGHESVRASLARAHSEGVLPASLLIHGPRGVGKQHLAQWVARLTVCDAPTPEGPCEGCRPCRMAGSLEHPDIHWFMPLERPKRVSGDRLGDALEELRFETLAEIRADPLRPSHSGGVRGLFLQMVHTINRSAHRRATMAPGPVFIIGEAELLVPQESSPEAANALLKLLEEPPGSARFILTSNAPGLLLPTTRSRTVPIQLGTLPVETVAAFIRRHADVGSQDVELAAALSRGAPGRALGFLEIGDSGRPLEKLRSRALDVVLKATARRVSDGYARALAFPPAGARALLELFDFVEEWLRDLAAVAAGADDRVFNRDALGRLRDHVAASGIRASDVPDAFGAVESARELARGNVNPQLIVSGLIRELRAALVDRRAAGVGSR